MFAEHDGLPVGVTCCSNLQEVPGSASCNRVVSTRCLMTTPCPRGEPQSLVIGRTKGRATCAANQSSKSRKPDIQSGVGLQIIVGSCCRRQVPARPIIDRTRRSPIHVKVATVKCGLKGSALSHIFERKQRADLSRFGQQLYLLTFVGGLGVQLPKLQQLDLPRAPAANLAGPFDRSHLHDLRNVEPEG